MLIGLASWLAATAVRADPSIRPRRRQMTWAAEDRRKYAPAIQETVRAGMIVRLARTMDAIDPRPRVGRA
jgi:hypothetical protein